MALTPSEILLIIKARDEASKAIDRVLGSTKTLNLNFGAMAKAATLAAATLVGVGAATGALVVKLGNVGVEVEGVRQAFAGLTGGSDETLRALREQSAGLISNTELMKSYNLASNLVSKQFADQLPEAMQYLTKVSRATGQSMTYMMDSLVRGVGRMSPLILDNLGIQVSLEEATQRAAEMFGKEADALSRTEQQAGMMNVVMEKLERNTASMPGVVGTATAKWQSLGATLRNIRDDIAVTVTPLLGTLGGRISSALEAARGAIVTLFSGFFETLRQLVNVATATVRSVGTALGIDFDKISDNAETWGENVVIMFAQGMANATLYIIQVINRIGEIITEWLEPGSPPKILPKIDEWGRDTIQAYLDGMGEGINYEQAQQALRGIQRFFEKEMRPLTDRMRGIAHERQDILDSMELERLQRQYGPQLARGFRDPNEERLVRLRMEELDVGMELRDLEEERHEAVTAAEDILFPLEREVGLLNEKVTALGSVKDALKGSTDAIAEVTNKALEMGSSTGDAVNSLTGLGNRIAQIFQPVVRAGDEMGKTWGGVFDLLRQKAAEVEEKLEPVRKKLQEIKDTETFQELASAMQNALPILGTLVTLLGGLAGAALISGYQLGIFTYHIDTLFWRVKAFNDVVETLKDLFGGPGIKNSIYDAVEQVDKIFNTKLRPHVETVGKLFEENGGFSKPVRWALDAVFNPLRLWLDLIKEGFDLIKQAAEAAKDAILALNAVRGGDDWSDAEQQAAEQLGLVRPQGISRFASGADFVTHGPRLIMVGEGGRERVQVTPMMGANAPTYQSNSQSTFYVNNPAAAAFYAQLMETRRLAERGAMI